MATQEVLNFWEQAAAQGISVTVSSGDSGSAGCDDPNTEDLGDLGLQVNGLGSTPLQHRGRRNGFQSELHQ